jgi:RND superfamily putative drug exporter
MKLLGKWNWYLPRWLQWLPEFDHERGSGRLGHGPVPAPAAA